MYHIFRFWNKAKWHPVTKFGTLWKELAVACHMDETGQLWPPFTLGLLPSRTTAQPWGDAIAFFGDKVNEGQ